ncbi:MAG: hypothetical protein KJO07_00550 [Deltaproteobacteria bacterium]|nr:hypothetical protein [Deltaproteobacteria bacterium]
MKNTIDEKDTIRDNVGASVAPETVDLRSGTGVAPETVNMRPRNAVQPTELGNKPAGVRRSTRATASALVAALLLLALGGVIGYRFAFYKIENDQGAL